MEAHAAVGERRKRVSQADAGTRVWATADGEQEAPKEELTCPICYDVFNDVRCAVA